MSIKSSLYFYFNKKKSIDYKIINGNYKTGLLEEPFLSERNINEVKIRNNDKPYFFYVEREPLTLNLNFIFEETWNKKLIKEIARWLDVDYYKELYFSDDITRIFYAMPINDINLIHNGLQQGYLKLTMRCDSPYSYSPIYESQIYDLSNNTSGTIIEFNNLGDKNCNPILYIQKVGIGSFAIYNLSNNNSEFLLTSLYDNEILTIYNEEEIIESSTGLYRYNNFNNNYLSLPVGYNKLKVVGNCKIKFKYRFKTLV